MWSIVLKIRSVKQKLHESPTNKTKTIECLQKWASRKAYRNWYKSSKKLCRRTAIIRFHSNCLIYWFSRSNNHIFLFYFQHNNIEKCGENEPSLTFISQSQEKVPDGSTKKAGTFFTKKLNEITINKTTELNVFKFMLSINSKNDDGLLTPNK